MQRRSLLYFVCGQSHRDGVLRHPRVRDGRYQQDLEGYRLERKRLRAKEQCGRKLPIQLFLRSLERYGFEDVRSIMPERNGVTEFANLLQSTRRIELDVY